VSPSKIFNSVTEVVKVVFPNKRFPDNFKFLETVHKLLSSVKIIVSVVPFVCFILVLSKTILSTINFVQTEFVPIVIPSIDPPFISAVVAVKLAIVVAPVDETASLSVPSDISTLNIFTDCEFTPLTFKVISFVVSPIIFTPQFAVILSLTVKLVKVPAAGLEPPIIDELIVPLTIVKSFAI
jgi:hypothetical protein